MERAKISSNQVYYILNRGVDKRQIFMDKDDYFRFIQDLWEFNDWAPAANIFYRKKALVSYEVEPQSGYRGMAAKQKGFLVEILAFALLPDHFQLLVRQSLEGGITSFMRKIGTGYTLFFNKKYKRAGCLFEGRYKIEKVKGNDRIFDRICAIHASPLDLKFPEWREGGLKKINEAINFLSEYQWSSYPDWTGKKNFPAIVKKNFLMKSSGGRKKYQRKFFSWLSDSNNDKAER